MDALEKLTEFEFEGQAIRCAGTDRAPWFALVDVVKVLGLTRSGSNIKGIAPEQRRVLRMNTRRRNSNGTFSLLMQDLVVIDEAALYELVVRSTSPSAKAFREWVTSVVLPAIRRTGEYRAAQASRYLAAGKDARWVEERVEGIQARRSFTDTLKDRQVAGYGYANCTDSINRPILGGSAKAVKARRRLGKNASLRDNLSTLELARVKLAELEAAARMETRDARGNDQCAAVCSDAGRAVAAVARMMSGQLALPE